MDILSKGWQKASKNRSFVGHRRAYGFLWQIGAGKIAKEKAQINYQ